MTSMALELQALADAAASEPEEAWDPLLLESKLASLPDVDVLLLWLNWQLRRYHWRAVPNYDEFQVPLHKRVRTLPMQVGNLASDLCTTPRIGTGGAALLQLLEMVAPVPNHQQSMNFLQHHEYEPEARFKAALAIVAEFEPAVADVVGLEQLLLCKAPDLNAAFVAKLFCAYPNMPANKSGSDQLSSASTGWNEGRTRARMHICVCVLLPGWQAFSAILGADHFFIHFLFFFLSFVLLCCG